MTRLVRLEESMAKSVPGSNLAAYVTFREMQADYAIRIGQATAQPPPRTATTASPNCSRRGSTG